MNFESANDEARNQRNTEEINDEHLMKLKLEDDDDFIDYQRRIFSVFKSSVLSRSSAEWMYFSSRLSS